MDRVCCMAISRYEFQKSNRPFIEINDAALTPVQVANILVGDVTSCVISDFGQSEMKSEVYRIACAPQLRMSAIMAIVFQRLTRSDSVYTAGGTLHWQAPELTEGTQTLTAEMDVYAFAISAGRSSTWEPYRGRTGTTTQSVITC